MPVTLQQLNARVARLEAQQSKTPIFGVLLAGSLLLKVMRAWGGA